MPPSDIGPRSCPVCSSAEGHKKLIRQRFQEGLLGDGYDVVVCGGCGAGFASGIVDQAEMDHYYANHSKYAYEASDGVESPFDTRRFELIADQLESQLETRDLRILEVGCATGGLLAVLKSRGFLNVYGVDPSQACATAARRLHGLDVRASTLKGLSGWTERFDLILLVGVLEHLGDVLAALKILAELINPKGFLFVAVPDVEHLADCRNAPFQQFSMEHVNFYSRSSLIRQLNTAGFSIRSAWQNVLEWREGITEPIVSGLFEKGFAGSVGFDADTENALVEYIRVCEEDEAAIRILIAEIARSGESILVWGVGALTRHLLASANLDSLNIVAFVDSNPHMIGTKLEGRMVLSKKELKGRKEPILVCTVAFEREIIEVIRKELLMNNRILTLSGTKA